MRVRLLLALFFVVLLGLAGAGGWWLFRPRDQEARAAQRAAEGDVRELALLQRNATAKEPENAALRLQLAQTMLKAYDGLAAEKGFRAAGTLGADRWTVLLGLGESFIIQGQWQTLLDTLPAVGPDPAMTAKLLLLRGTAQIGLEQVQAAGETQRKLAEVAPKGGEAPLLAARVALAQQDVAEADRQLDAALAVNPNEAEVLQLKLRTAIARGDRAAAESFADRAIAAAPWAIGPYIDRAGQEVLAGDDAKARADVDRVLARFPRAPGARYIDALLLARANKLPEANAAFEALGPVVDSLPRALFAQSLVAGRLGNTAAAVALAERYVARTPGDLAGVELLARAEIAAGRPAAAVQLLEGATAGSTPNPTLLDLLGAAYAGTGNTPASLRVRQQAAQLAPANPRILADLGLSQLRQGDVTGAIETLGRSSDMAVLPAAGIETLFRAALSVGDLDRADAVIDRRQQQEGDTLMVATMRAVMLAARSDTAGAVQAYQGIIQKYPAALEPRRQLARLLAQTGRPAEAEAVLTELLAKAPADMAGLTTAVQIWLADKRADTALRALDKAQAAEPNNDTLLALRSEVLVRSGRPKAALDLLELRRGVGVLPTALLPAAASAQIASGNMDAALASLTTALRTLPGSFELRMAQVGVLVQGKRLDDALASLREGLAQAPGQPVLMHAMVDVAQLQGGPEAARSMATGLRGDAANMPGAAVLLGDLLMQTRQPALAAKALQAEFQAAPSQALLVRLANAQLAAGQDSEATTALRGWLATHPDEPEASALLSQADLRAGRLDEAQTGLEARLRRRPNDPAALNNLAWLYQRKNDPRALETARRAYLLAPAPQIADTLGWALLQSGDANAALPLLQQAAAALPGNASVGFHLASALGQAGKPGDSVALLEAMLARPEPFEERPAAETLLRRLKPVR